MKQKYVVKKSKFTVVFGLRSCPEQPDTKGSGTSRGLPGTTNWLSWSIGLVNIYRWIHDLYFRNNLLGAQVSENDQKIVKAKIGNMKQLDILSDWILDTFKNLPFVFLHSALSYVIYQNQLYAQSLKRENLKLNKVEKI